MTVLTGYSFEKKNEKAPTELVDIEAVSSKPQNSKRNIPLSVTWSRAKAQNITSWATFCVFITALMVFTTGIIGGVYVFRQFTQYRVSQPFCFLLLHLYSMLR